MRRLFLGLVAPVAVFAQLPQIYPHGILNAASFAAAALPNGGIARGSIFSIFGSGLGPAKGIQVSAFPLQTAFNGVSITVTQGATVVNAIPLYIRQDQINALMPSNAPLGWASVMVTYNNARSNPSPVNIVNDSAGIFTSTGTGIGPGALNNFASQSSQPPNSTAAAAKPGQLVTMYATGLGPIATPDNQAPPAGSLPTPVELWVGGIPANVSYAGRSPCCAGLDQITFTVPAGAPRGCWVPVEVRTSHATVSNFVSMAIDPKGAACSDPTNPVAATVAKGGSLGMLELTRVIVHEDIGVNAPIDVTNDIIGFSATKQGGGPFAFSPFRSVPPPGTCTVYPGVGDFFETAQVSEAAATNLDAGKSLTVAGNGSPQQVALSGEFAPLGSYLPLYSIANQLYLSPGSYTVTGSGGADVRAFQAKINMPNAINWTNRDQIATVDRSHPLTLEWSGAAAQQAVQILGIDSDLPTDSSAMFLCTVPAGASSFTVPPEVLSAIPASRRNLSSKAAIYLMPWTSSSFTATGLQTGLAAARYVLGKTVSFQ